MQQASCLEGGPQLCIWPLYLHVNKKSDDDDDELHCKDVAGPVDIKTVNKTLPSYRVHTIEVRNKMLLELLRVLSGCYYLFIYAYDVKTASICLYQVLVAKLNPNFTFPNLRHPKIGFPTFIRNPSALVSYTATDCLKQM